MDDDIKTAADTATNCVQALTDLRSAAITIVDMGQEWLGRDTLLKAKKDLKKYCGSEFARVIKSVRPILLEARSKHMHAKQSMACRVTKPTAMEVALMLACGVTKHLNDIPSEGLGGRSYVQSCANSVRCFEHDEAELKHLASEISMEGYWAGVVKKAQVKVVQPDVDEQVDDASDTPPMDADTADDPVLGERAQLVLTVLLSESAFSSDSRVKTAEITAKAAGPEADPNAYKKVISSLASLGYVSTREGRGGGCWLTGKGKQRADKL